MPRFRKRKYLALFSVLCLVLLLLDRTCQAIQNRGAYYYSSHYVYIQQTASFAVSCVKFLRDMIFSLPVTFYSSHSVSSYKIHDWRPELANQRIGLLDSTIAGV